MAKFLQVEKKGVGWFEVAGSTSIQRAGSAIGRTAGAPRRFLARRGRGVRVGARRRVSIRLSIVNSSTITRERERLR